jgi:3-oxoacyl-[acyl-carrier protein] reductase
MSLAGKRALITGGKTGLGAAIARLFYEEGARVLVASRSCEPTFGTKDDTAQIVHDRVDVRDADSVNALMDRVHAHWDGLDILVTCAATMVNGLVWKLAPGDARSMVDTNFTGTLNCIAAVRPLMPKGSAIVTMSSTITSVAAPGTAVYHATKSAVEGLTAVAAADLGRTRVRVNSVAAGFITTGLSTPLMEEPERWARYEERIALGRAGAPEEIAKAVRFLASDDASYITGQVLHVDGGLMFP